MASGNAVYKSKRAASLTGLVGAAASIVLSQDSSSIAAYVLVPFGRVSGVPFRVRASGYVTIGAGGTSTFLPGIYYNSSASTATTLTAGNLVAGAASTALTNAVSYPWMVETQLVWDSTSQVMGGYYTQYVGIASGFVLQSVLINLQSSIDLSVAKAGFNLGITMGTTRTGSTVVVNDFTLEVL